MAVLAQTGHRGIPCHLATRR